MKNAFLFQTTPIDKDSDLWKQFTTQNILFYHFKIQRSEKYYLFIFGEKPISLDFTLNSSEMEVLRKIESKKRQIRSLRGFILYVLELEPRKELATNLPAFFWTDVQTVLKQRKKNGLHEFLFGKEAGDEDTKIQLEKMQDEIEILRRQISLLKN